jgi:hypothetical protein
MTHTAVLRAFAEGVLARPTSFGEFPAAALGGRQGGKMVARAPARGVFG